MENRRKCLGCGRSQVVGAANDKDKQTRFIIPCLTLLLMSLFTPSALYGDSATYTVKKGDTLYSIAGKFDVSLDTLLAVNEISDPTRVPVGTLLKIPGNAESPPTGKTYVVQRGDTLYSLSRRYAVSLAELLRVNGLTLKSLLKVGQRIMIPVKEAYAEKQIALAQDSGEVDAQGKTEVLKNQGIPFWPHPGSIQKMRGKLSSAVAIIGRKGDSVVSVSTGTVTWAAPFRGFGKMVFVKSMSGYVYGYGGHNHLFVKVGDRVNVGTEIGSLGTNSHDGIAKVFFFVTKDGKPYEPSQAPRG